MLLTVIFVLLSLVVGRAANPEHHAQARMPTKTLTIIPGTTSAELTLGTAREFYRRAPVVVIAGPDPAASRLAARTAVRLRLPLLSADLALPAALKRLSTNRAVVFGDVSATALSGVKRVSGTDLTAAPATAAIDTIVVTCSTRKDSAALINARNVGATILELPGGDPRGNAAAAELLKGRADSPVIALGTSFKAAFRYTLDVVRHAPAQPGGGYFVFPGRTMVALYGHPSSGALGVLGEKGLTASIARAKRTARAYQRMSKKPVVPAFEIIATVASAEKGKDKNYSTETPLSVLRPWVTAATKAGMYVVLDLQPGRSDFLSQAKRYESLLALPHVGLALDPEWRLTRHQVPLHQIGSVDIAEINRTADWLAELTRKHSLPQKLLILHQFQPRMICGRKHLSMGHPELSILIHVDGQGSQPAKRGTWHAIRNGAPRGVFWGWKNFYDEDKPTLSIAKTWRNVKPRPEFISYQ